MNNIADDFHNKSIYILIASSLILGFSLISISIMVYMIHSDNTKLISMLFSLTHEQLLQLNERLRKFINMIKENNDSKENIDSEDQNNNANNIESISNIKIKEYSKSYIKMILYILIFLFFYLIFDAYYIIYHYNNKDLVNKFTTYKTEINQTAEVMLWSTNSAFRYMYFTKHKIDLINLILKMTTYY